MIGERFPRLLVQTEAGKLPPRILSGYLDVLWPGDRCPEFAKAALVVRKHDCVVEFGKVIASATGPGSEALMRRAAEAVLVSASADHIVGSGFSIAACRERSSADHCPIETAGEACRRAEADHAFAGSRTVSFHNRSRLRRTRRSTWRTR